VLLIAIGTFIDAHATNLARPATDRPTVTLSATAENSSSHGDEPHMSRAVAIGLKLQLVTAQRRGELLKARWSDIDLEEKLWIIPEAHLKAAKKAPQEANGAEDENRREKAQAVVRVKSYTLFVQCQCGHASVSAGSSAFGSEAGDCGACKGSASYRNDKRQKF
jgi:hypothetical protein